jgi:hypothetical protein
MRVEPDLLRFIGRCIFWCLPRPLIARWPRCESYTDHVVSVDVIQRDGMGRKVHVEHPQVAVRVHDVMEWLILNRYCRRWFRSHRRRCDYGVKHGQTLSVDRDNLHQGRRRRSAQIERTERLLKGGFCPLSPSWWPASLTGQNLPVRWEANFSYKRTLRKWARLAKRNSLRLLLLL